MRNVPVFYFQTAYCKSKACFEFKLRHPDNETFADTVFKFIRAFDTAPRRTDLRTAVVLIGFARVQNRLLFNQAGMTDLLCLTVSIGNFPKTLTQSNDFITAVADGNQIIEGIAVAIDVTLTAI